jgi:hypothetical protein
MRCRELVAGILRAAGKQEGAGDGHEDTARQRHDAMKSLQILTFGCVARAMVGAAALSALASCADPGRQWHKAGVADARRDQDYQECRALSRDSSQSGVDQDVAASRAGTGHGPAGADDAAPSVETGATREASESMITCMTDRGYRGE